MTQTLSPVFPNIQNKSRWDVSAACLFNRVGRESGGSSSGGHVLLIADLIRISTAEIFHPTRTRLPTRVHMANTRNVTHRDLEKHNRTQRHFESRRDDERVRVLPPNNCERQEIKRKKFCLVLRHYRDIEPCRMVWVSFYRTEIIIEREIQREREIISN